MVRVDAREWRCPMPLLKLKQALRNAEAGQQIELLASDQGSARDIPAWLSGTPHQLQSVQEADGIWCFCVRVSA